MRVTRKGSPFIFPTKKNKPIEGRFRDFIYTLLGDFNTLTYESIKFKLLYGADTLILQSVKVLKNKI